MKRFRSLLVCLLGLGILLPLSFFTSNNFQKMNANTNNLETHFNANEIVYHNAQWVSDESWWYNDELLVKFSWTYTTNSDFITVNIEVSKDLGSDYDGGWNNNGIWTQELLVNSTWTQYSINEKARIVVTFYTSSISIDLTSARTAWGNGTKYTFNIY
jgi:hypothetical protein